MSQSLFSLPFSLALVVAGAASPVRFETAHAAAQALYRALDKGDVAGALACFDTGEDVIAVGPAADAVAVGRKSLEMRATKIFALGAKVGRITRAKVKAGAGPTAGGVFLDDIDVPGSPPVRIQILLGRFPDGGWRVRLFHAAHTLPDDQAGALAVAGAFPMAGWPHLPPGAPLPAAVDTVSRAWHQALADGRPDRFMALMTAPDVLGAGSAPHERAGSWKEYAAQIGKLLEGRKPKPPVFGATVGFIVGTLGWSLNAYTIEVTDGGKRGAVPVRATVVLEREGTEWRMRTFFASVPRPARPPASSRSSR